MLILDATVVNVALPKIDADLGFGPASPVVGAERLHPRLRRPAAARWPARRRVRPAPALLRIGVAVFTLASVLGGLAQTPEWLVARARPPGRRRRDGRARRTRAAHHERSRRGRPGSALSRCSAPSPPAACPSACCSVARSPTSAPGAGRCSSTCPIGLAMLALTRRYLDETPTPARPVRRRRGRHRHRWVRSRSCGR